MSRLVCLAEFWNVYDAAAAITALEAAGIAAFSPDWHFFDLYPHLMMATSGPRVWVPEDQVDDAKRVVGTAQSGSETCFPCPKCGNRTYRMRRWLLIIPMTWLMLQLGLYATYGPLAFYKRKRFCWSCYHQHLPDTPQPFTKEELGYTP